MARAALPTGIELEYERVGDPADPTLLLVSGFGSQMISWADELVGLFADEGFDVVRFDNRDVGLSTKLDGRRVQPQKVLRAVIDGTEVPDVPYTLSDMAADAVGLLDHLGVERAHVAGKSMGGMIVQLMAIEHPTRVASLTSIMSRPGDQTAGHSTPEARDALLAPPPADRDGAVEAAGRSAIWASRRYFDLEAARDLAGRQYDRAYYPQGATRQLAAIYATPDWSDGLRVVDVPTLVLHGLDDTLITPEGGVATAELIPDSRLELLADMGHDMPRELWPNTISLIADHCRSAAHV